MQTEKNIWLRMLSMILTLALLISCVPNQVYAMAGEALAELLEQEETAETIETPNETKRGVYEVTERREANVKHFALEDGTYTAVMYGSAVHTQDAEGNWQDIDNRLSASGSEFSTSNARIKFAKKITGNENLFTLHDGNRKITMSLNNAIKKTAGTVTNHTTEFDSEATQLQKLMTLDNLSSEILYADILDGVDLQYVVESLNVKENIIVKQQKDSYQYTFTIALNNLEAEMAEDGSVRIYDSDTKETVYNIPTGFMYDANGEYSNAVVYTLTNGGNGKHSLTVTADAAWINAEERVFPVVIDPTISTGGGNSYDYTSIHSWMSDEGGNTLNYLAAGTYGTAYWRINTLPALPAGAYITNASLTASRYTVSAYPNSSNTLELAVHKVISEWDPDTFCYSDFYAGTAGQYEEYAVDAINGENASCQYVWNITDVVREWYNVPSSNLGVAIKCTNKNGGDLLYRFTCGTVGQPLCINYKQINGMEDYWSYTTQSVRLAGNGYINNATGKLNFSIGTLTATDSLFAYAPTLIWDQDFAGQYVENDLEGNLGYGFRINTYETITAKSYVNSNNEEITYYTWTDWDGTMHDFYPNNADTGVFCDDDGMQLTLTIENNQFVLSDRNHTEKIFLSSGLLSSIVDKNGNKLVFDYQNNRVSSIKVVPNGYSTITALTFNYNSYGLLCAVVNSDTMQSVKLYYSPTKTASSASTNSYGYLMKVIRTDHYATAAECHYEYDTSGRLSSAYDKTSNYKVRYTYVDGLVYTATEYVGTTSQSGQKVQLTYRNQYCEVQSSGTDDVFGNTDDIVNVYTFDTNGRVTSAYSIDAARTKIYGASSGEYEEQENVKNNIKTSTTVGGAASNYILNGDFDGYYTTGSLASYWHKTGNVSDVSATSEVHDHYSARFGLVRNTLSSLQQCVFLREGDYTLSVDVEAQYATDVDAYLLVESRNNSTNRFSQEIPLDETAVVKNTLTVSLNFNAIDYNLTGGEEFLVWIIVQCGSHPNTDGYVIVDNVMLEEGIGHSGYSLVEFGNFESSSVAWSHGNASTWSHVWDTDGTVHYENQLMGNVLKVDTEIGDSRIVASQTIYNAYGSSYNTEPKSFIISGMAKGTQQYASGEFGIELYVLYEDGTSEPIYLDFHHTSTEWQFVCQSFTTKNQNIERIDIRLIYKNPGLVYFDNIYVTQVEDDFSSKTEYYSNGLVHTQKDSHYEETYLYDNNGNVIQVSNSNDERYVYTYDQYNNVTKVQFYGPDENGSVSLRTTTEYNYNSIGKITSQYTYDGSSLQYAEHYVSASYSYDMDPTSRTFGALLHETDNKGIRTFHFYDPDNGRLLASVNADAGTGNCYTYDSAGRTTSVRPATFSWNDLDYDPVTNSAQVSYSYNSQNLLAKITTPTSEYTFYYDGFGNTDSVEVGGNEIISYDYNDYNGKLKTVTYASGFVVKYTYDELENLSEVWYNDGGEDYPAYKYLYNAYGQIYRFENHISGTHIIYDYDASNRLIGYTEYDAEEMVNHFSTKYAYDDFSRIEFLQYSFDYLEGFYGVSNSKVEYRPTYEKDGTVKSFFVGTSVANGAISYGYDVYNRLEYKNQSFVCGTTVYESAMSYEYAGNGNTTQPTTALIETVTSTVMGNSLEYTYEYNDRNQITKITMSNGRVNRYYYDDLGQLTQEDVAGLGMTYTYTYDKAGNILSKSYYAYTAEGVTPSNPLYVYSYVYGDENWGDKLTSYRGQGITYDVIGNPLSYYNGTRWNFTWQSGRQLATATAGSKTCSFTYNDSGIRTSKTVNGTTHTYYLDGDRIIAEEWNGIVLVFLYDDNNSPIGMLYRDSQDATGDFEIYWYEKNVQGDIVAVYDGTGNKLINYVYDACGNFYEGYTQANANSHARLNPFRYRGYYYDTDLKMYYLQSRYYDPVIGRFISPDKFATTGQSVLGANMFAYCANDPVNYVDDEGTYYIWYVLKKTGNWGFVHRCVQAEIGDEDAGILTEVVIPKYVPEMNRKVNYRADVVNHATGSVWEIKHAGAIPDIRINVAQKQARYYINGDYNHHGKEGRTTGLGMKKAFSGQFKIAVGNTAYLVEYDTPAEGAILYKITELGNKSAYRCEYLLAFEEKQKAEEVVEENETLGLAASVFIPVFVMPRSCLGSGGVTAIYGGHNWLMKPKFETS